MQAQGQILVKGVVKDNEGNNLPGTNIYESKPENGTISNAAGMFELRTINKETTIHLSYIGFKIRDIKINTENAELDLGIIQLEQDSLNIDKYFIDNIHWEYFSSLSVGYFGGYRYTPIGVTVKYFRPYLFRFTFLLTTELRYKTDLNNNNDFYLSLSRNAVIHKPNYSLAIQGAFREMSLKIEQNRFFMKNYSVLTQNIIGKYVGLTLGGVYRDLKFIDKQSQNIGVCIGIVRLFRKYDLTIGTESTIFKNNIPFRIYLFKDLLDNFTLGLEYEKNIDYREIKTILRYKIL